jgi:hypothetical protein
VGDDPYLGNKQGDEWRRYSFKETDRLSSAFGLSLIALIEKFFTKSLLNKAQWALDCEKDFYKNYPKIEG